MAIGHAKEVCDGRGRPIDLGLALGFLPLVAGQRPEEYDGWALRWLGRWINEAPVPTIDQGGRAGGVRADLPTEPSAWETIKAQLGRTRSA